MRSSAPVRISELTGDDDRHDAEPKPDPNRVVTLPGPLQGALLIADRGNDRILLVDPHRRTPLALPDRCATVRRGVALVFDDDTFVEPGGKALVTNEEDNGDILSINIKTHRVTKLFGVPGPQAGTGGHAGPPNHLNWPDDAYVLPDGTMTVADAYRCRILFIRHRRIVRQIGQTDVCAHNPPRTLGWVNGDTPMPERRRARLGDQRLVDRRVLADRASCSGLPGAGLVPVRPQPLSRGRILLADYASPGAVLIVNRHGQRRSGATAPASGWGALNHPSLAIMLPNGDIAVNDDYNDRVVIIDPKKSQIVWQYGHLAQPGRGGDFLHTPDGMDYIPLGPHEKPLWQLVHHP